MNFKSISGLFELRPVAVGIPRFTFPYTLIGRMHTYQVEKLYKTLPREMPLCITEKTIIRTEFFGTICFESSGSTFEGYGFLIYSNKLGSYLLSLCDGENTIASIMQQLLDKSLHVSESEVEKYYLTMINYGVINFCKKDPETMYKYNPDYSLWGSNDSRLLSPLRLYLNITQRCNLNCTHCYANAGSNCIQELSRKQISDLFHQAVEMKIPTIVLIGGEPLIYKGFLSVVEEAHRLGLSIYVASNAIAISEAYAKKMKDVGLNCISVSVDGANAKTHDELRGHGAYEKALRGAKNCLKNGIGVTISTTITSENICEIGDMVDFWVSEGVLDFQLMVFSPVGRGSHGNKLVPNNCEIVELKEILYGIISKYRNVHINCTGVVNASILENWHEKLGDEQMIKYVYTGCEAGRFRCDINFNGDIIPCILLSNIEFVKYNISQHSIKDAWTSRLFRDIGGTSTQDKAVCEKCEGYHVCRGGCKGVIYSVYGNLSNQYPTCSNFLTI
ncbi:MAG: radical SAM protein [Oscillospiraceae bacterium]|nr:radical SAM protein [Oscillospiraceae bacterium]